MRKRKKHLKRWVKLCLLVSLVTCFVNFKKIKNDIPQNVFREYSEIIEEQKGETTFEKLQKQKKSNPKIAKILENYEEYPEILLEMLTRDEDLLDFVVEYPEKKGSVQEGNLEDFKKGSIPLLLQWDERWGYASYGSSSIAISGCGPTALAMVVTSLTLDKSITPYKVAKMAEEKGYYQENMGTSWTLMSEGAQEFGIKSRELPLSKEQIEQALKNHHPIICSMKPGDFTTTGHFIVLTGLIDGKIQVNDPNSKKRSQKLWSYERLEKQIKNLWEFWQYS